MNTLHTINKTGQPLELCLRSASEQDAILLIEDGVYVLLNQHEQLSHFNVYVLGPDAAARGINPQQPVTTINYEGFVTLTTQYQKTLSWF